MYKTFFLIFVPIFMTCSTFQFISCSNQQQIIAEKDKFCTVLADLMIIESLSVPEEMKIALFDSVLAKEQIKPEDFKYTKQYYENDPVLWIEIFQKTEDILKERKKIFTIADEEKNRNYPRKPIKK